MAALHIHHHRYYADAIVHRCSCSCCCCNVGVAVDVGVDGDVICVLDHAAEYVVTFNVLTVSSYTDYCKYTDATYVTCTTGFTFLVRVQLIQFGLSSAGIII